MALLAIPHHLDTLTVWTMDWYIGHRALLCRQWPMGYSISMSTHLEHYPLQHRVGINLEDPSGGADTQTFGQAGHNPHDQLHRGLFAMEARAVMFGKLALARDAVKLPPGAAIDRKST